MLGRKSGESRVGRYRRVVRHAAVLIVAGAAFVACAAEGRDEGVGVVQQADTSPWVTANITTSGSVVTVSTQEMPKGWFTKFGGFYADKSPITLSWSIGASSCLPGASGSASTADGTFTAIDNPTEHPVAYVWSDSIDFAAYQNHWHNLIGCDGSTTVVGCPDARTVNVTLSVGGSCGNNQDKCTDMASAQIPSVQDPDVVETNCGGGCPIGPCVSACQHLCNNAKCAQCCECKCKEAGLEGGNPACKPQKLCFQGSKGHPACL